MPYKSIRELPKGVRNHLPKEAQHTYLVVFNNAYKQYHSDERAAKVAWAAVKRGYKKGSGDQWVRKKAA